MFVLEKDWGEKKTLNDYQGIEGLKIFLIGFNCLALV